MKPGPDRHVAWRRGSGKVKKTELVEFDGHDYISAEPNEQVLWLRRS